MKKIWTNLKKSPEYLNETIGLIEKSFNYSKEYSFENDFKPLLDISNRENCHLLVNEDNIVIAHIAVIKKQIIKHPISTPACFIGAIVVNPDFRGQGIFKTFFSAIIDLYKDDCALFLLWSEKSNLYEKFNFFEFGKVLQVDIKKSNDTFTPLALNELSDIQFESIIKLHKNIFEGHIAPQRTLSDWECLRTQLDVTCFVDDIDNITKYFLMNKGMDLNDVVHECSFLNDLNDLTVFPKCKLWLPEALKESVNYDLDLYLGTMRLNANELSIAFIEDIFNKDLKVLNFDEENISFIFNSQTYELETSEFITLCFGPNAAEEFSKYGNCFYIPGLDSA